MYVMPDSVTFGDGAPEDASLRSYITAVGGRPAVAPCFTHSGHCSWFVVCEVFHGFVHPAFEVARIFGMIGPKFQTTRKLKLETGGVNSGEDNTGNSSLKFDGLVVVLDF